MTAIDLEEKARLLGVSFDDYRRADDAMDEKFWEFDGEWTDNEYIESVKSLDEKAMVAFIRWRKCYEIFPDHFDWNGVVEK